MAENKVEKPQNLALDTEFPLADDGEFRGFYGIAFIGIVDSVPNEVDNVAKTPRQANPLPREEAEDQEEKGRLIAQILELQNTLEGTFGFSDLLLSFKVSPGPVL